MKYAVSTIALPSGDHSADLARVAGLGADAVEVAPSRRWEDTWHGLKGSQVDDYRRAIESAGLEVVGLHSLVFDHPELQLFGDRESRTGTLEFMVHLSGVCRDLGGRTLIWGGGRKRGKIPATDAFDIAVDFMGNLCDRTADDGTVFCFEPLGPNDSDFVNGVSEAIRIADTVNRGNLQIQIDAKALVENDEVTPETFEAARSRLVHVHANEPGLAVIGSSGAVDHARIGTLLHEIGYDGYVSAEQRMFDGNTWAEDVAESLGAIRRYYCNGETS